MAKKSTTRKKATKTQRKTTSTPAKAKKKATRKKTTATKKAATKKNKKAAARKEPARTAGKPAAAGKKAAPAKKKASAAKKKGARKVAARAADGQLPTKPAPRKVAAASTGRGKATRARVAEVVAAPPEPARPKTRLSDDDLKEFTTLLLRKRAELVGDVNHLRSEALHEGEESSQSSTVPIHMADISSDRWEQEFSLVLMESEQKLLREIDAALERITERTYGVCEGTGKPITKRRLRAKPWARYCIEYARQKELGLVR